MNNQWKAIKFGVLLFALPLVATAAASAHQWMVESSPISLNTPTLESVSSAISMERVHTVALDGNGVIEGRIANIDSGSENTEGIAKLKIFFVQDGTVVKESFTRTDGTFVIEGLPEGDYSFVASGQNGFAAYGVRVITDVTGEFDNVMEVAAVSSGVSAAKKIVNDAMLGTTVVAQEQGVAAMDNFEGANQVKLVDGALKGRVQSMSGKSDAIGQTMIHIVKGNEKVAEVQADASGAFEVSDLAPGVYDFVAVGPSGVAVLAFEAVSTVEVSAVGLLDAQANPVSVELNSATEVSLATVPNYAASFNVLLVEPQDVEPVPSPDSVIDTDGGGVSDAQEIAQGTDPNNALDDGGALPIEFAGQDAAFGAASGGSAGSAGTFSSFASTPVSGGGAGAAAGIGGGGRLLTLGLIGGVIALGVTNGSNPVEASPVTP